MSTSEEYFQCALRRASGNDPHLHDEIMRRATIWHELQRLTGEFLEHFYVWAQRAHNIPEATLKHWLSSKQQLVAVDLKGYRVLISGNTKHSLGLQTQTGFVLYLLNPPSAEEVGRFYPHDAYQGWPDLYEEDFQSFFNSTFTELWVSLAAFWQNHR